MEKEEIIKSLKEQNNNLPHSCAVFKAARIYSNLTVTILSEKLEITKSALSQIESGKRKPSLKIIKKLCDICKEFKEEDFYSFKL